MPLVSRLLENRIIRAAIIIVLAMLAAVSVFQGSRNALEFSQDFQWDAAKALCMRLDPYELSQSPQRALEYPELKEFYSMFTDKGLAQKMEANQFPSLLALLAPMTLLAPVAAKTVWLLLNLAFTAGIVFLLRRTFLEKLSDFGFAFTVLLMLAGTPYRNQIGVGQHTLFAFFFFLLAVYIEKINTRKHTGPVIVLIAACLFVSYFKYTLTAPLALYFVYKKRYKELALSVAGHVILTEVAALWLGKSFLYMITAPLKVASALTSEGGIDFGVLIGGVAAFVVAFVFAADLSVITYLTPWRKDYILFPMLILWSLILTYHRTYDFFVLSVVPMLFCDDFVADLGEKCRTFMRTWYAVLIAEVYFVLRLFGESTASLIGTGIIYYGFTIAVTWLTIKIVRNRNNV